MGQGFFFCRHTYRMEDYLMTESDLQELNWTQVAWNRYVYQNQKMLLWLPNDRVETTITALNNYSNIYFKGIIETKEEIEFITNLLTKPDKI